MRGGLSFIIGVCTWLALPASVQTAEVTAKTPLKRGMKLSASDISITLSPDEYEEDVLRDYVGKIVLRSLYKGASINPRDISEPILINRNSEVIVHYSIKGLKIKTKGRALSEASAGELVTVINASSRSRIEGIATAPGVVEVLQ